jgi:hypothetical protein
MSRLREEQRAAMSRLREEQQVAMSRLREEQQVAIRPSSTAASVTLTISSGCGLRTG